MRQHRQRPARLSAEQVGVVHGLLHDLGTPVWSATYTDHPWEREHAAQRSVNEALSRAFAGGRSAVTEPRARPPRWLGVLVRRHLEDAATTYYTSASFRWVRRLERLGLIEIPHDDTYVLAALAAPGVQCKTDQVLSYLDADPELRDQLFWRLFEVEGGGNISLANIDSFGGTPWQGAVLALVADGTVPRERVLDSCLEALARDFNQYRAKWFSGLWVALEPTSEERLARQGLLLPVLRSSAPPVVSFAVRELATAHRTGALDPLVTVPALAPAVQARAKGTALAALKLAASLATVDPAADAAALARGALEHPHPDVQAAAGRLLAGWGEDEAVRAAADSMAPAVRAELGVTSAAAVARWEPVPFAPAPPVSLPTHDAEVVELAAALLEDASDPYAVEALLGALATGRGAAGLSSLAPRARKVLRSSTDHGGGVAGVPGQVADLVLASIGEHGPRFPDWVRRHVPVLLHLRGRFAEVADVVGGRRPPAPMLATPDLAGGLLSPATLLDRVGTRVDLPAHGLSAALLRLDDEGRDGVLRRFGHLVDPSVVALAGDPLTGPATRSRLEYRVKDASWAPHLVVDLVVSDPAEGAASLEITHHYPDLADWLGLFALVLPHDAEHFAALAHHDPFRATQSANNYQDTLRTLDLLASHPGRHGHLSATVVTYGLAAARGDQRVHAVDALVDLVTTGRLTPLQVADALAEHGPHLTAPRWAESLAAAGAAVGPGLPVEVLTRALPATSPQLRGLHAPLQVLLDETLRSGQHVTDPELRTWLGAITGSSKAARTARRLLAA